MSTPKNAKFLNIWKMLIERLFRIQGAGDTVPSQDQETWMEKAAQLSLGKKKRQVQFVNGPVPFSVVAWNAFLVLKGFVMGKWGSPG